MTRAKKGKSATATASDEKPKADKVDKADSGAEPTEHTEHTEPTEATETKDKGDSSYKPPHKRWPSPKKPDGDSTAVRRPVRRGARRGGGGGRGVAANAGKVRHDASQHGRENAAEKPRHNSATWLRRKRGHDQDRSRHGSRKNYPREDEEDEDDSEDGSGSEDGSSGSSGSGSEYTSGSSSSGSDDDGTPDGSDDSDDGGETDDDEGYEDETKEAAFIGLLLDNHNKMLDAIERSVALFAKLKTADKKLFFDLDENRTACLDSIGFSVMTLTKKVMRDGIDSIPIDDEDSDMTEFKAGSGKSKSRSSLIDHRHMETLLENKTRDVEKLGRELVTSHKMFDISERRRVMLQSQLEALRKELDEAKQASQENKDGQVDQSDQPEQAGQSAQQAVDEPPAKTDDAAAV